MKYLRQDLLVLLISLFIFSSCQKSDLVGLNIDPNTLLKSEFIDTSINALTVREDSVFTNGLNQHPLGYLEDPIFGTTEANLAMAVSLPSSSLTFGTEPTLDSVVLVLRHGKEFFGDSSANYTIEVSQLASPYVAGSYSNNKTWTKGDLLGSKGNVHFAWGDSVRITQRVRKDSTISATVYPQLRIKLDNAFFNQHFINGTTTNFATSAAFNTFFKGLYLTISNRASLAGKGGIAFLDLQAANNSMLEVYYKTKPDTGTIKDPALVSFPISSSSAASHIKHDYTGSVVNSQIGNPSADKLYLQPLAGLRAKLSFGSNLNALKALGNISVNKAELVISVVGGTDSPLKPAPRLTLYRTDIAGQRKPVPDNAIGLDARYVSEPLFGGFYDSAKKQYRFVITSYIQDILTGKLREFDTFLAPINKTLTGTYNISPAGNTAARVVVGGKGNPNYEIKLNVLYTKPD